MRAKGVKDVCDWLQGQIEAYEAVRPDYEAYAQVLEDILSRAARRYAPLAIVQARAKSVASFAQKALLEKANYADPVNEFTDLCGARVVAHTQDEVKALCEFVRRHFDIDWTNSVSVEERLKPTEFGYRCVHYIIGLTPGVFPTADVEVRIPATLLRRLTGLKAEIQVRTLLEHAWADFTHDRSYKSAFPTPPTWERELATTAAVLESGDAAFCRIEQGLSAYRATYGSYLTRTERERESALLEVILRRNRRLHRAARSPAERTALAAENASLAGRIAKLAIASENWPKAVSILSPHRRSRTASVLRDLGVAMCKQHRGSKRGRQYRQGQRYLEEAVALAPHDVDSICSLAGTWKGLDEGNVCKLYQQAFEVDPTDPYALGNHLECQTIRSKDISAIASLRPSIGASIRRCRDQVAVGVNLPWAFYSIGQFCLLLGEGYEYQSLAAYAKAIQVSPAPWMLQSALGSISRLSVIRTSLPAYEWVRRLLLLALALRFPDSDEGKAARRRVTRLASRGHKPIAGRVVVVAGGCEPTVPVGAHRSLLLSAFRDFTGTILGGGTTAGVSGLVGEIQRRYRNAVTTVGYVPSPKPRGAPLDKRYTEIRRTRGRGFSPMEPLQGWIDLLAPRLDASEVKVLGIDGGPITAAEHHIALALGAKAAVLRETGREAAGVARDEDWGASEALIHLPADVATARAFIGSPSPRLPPDIREAMAKAVHASYRVAHASHRRADDPAMAEWDDLPENLKESNCQQADYYAILLREVKCTVYQVDDRPVAHMTFSDEEIETMAEVEHARWTVERLLDGWRWGPERDIARKMSPYLVGWSKLPEDVKDWDRDTLRKMPKTLSMANLEVGRAPKGAQGQA